MSAYLVRLNDCPLFVLKVPSTAGLDGQDVRLLARRWLLGEPLPAEARAEEATRGAAPDALARGEQGPVR